jgi:RNA polymerase sigma-70 factor (ECF subfamily)
VEIQGFLGAWTGRSVPLLSTDRVLLGRFRSGEPDALGQVFRHYAPGLASSIRRGVRILKGKESVVFPGPSNELEVRRLVQETFSRAFTPAARLSYDGITPFRAYLARIARNHMINEAKARRRAEVLTEDGELPDLESPAPDASEQAEQAEFKEAVGVFMATRPDVEKQVYQARYGQGLSQEAAASTLGLARITVRRAESRLKAAFLAYVEMLGLGLNRGPGQGGAP